MSNEYKIENNNLPLPVQSRKIFRYYIIDLTGLSHLEIIRDKYAEIINIIRCLLGVWWGIHPFCLILLYKTLFSSVLD